jgi:hypothetical protein
VAAWVEWAAAWAVWVAWVAWTWVEWAGSKQTTNSFPRFDVGTKFRDAPASHEVPKRYNSAKVMPTPERGNNSQNSKPIFTIKRTKT